MMTAAEFIHAELTRLHRNLDGCIADVTPEQLHAIPAGHPRANSLAFGLWHYARTEDNVVRFVLQGRRPTVWMEGQYAERLGLPATAQGTGMPPAEAQALRIGDVTLFRQYMRQVWASTEELFERAAREPALLDQSVVVKPIGEMPGVRALGQVCLSHGMGHYGELELIRTLLGLKTVAGV
jgi:DinB superfamily